jgi:hypothetical protein
MQIRDVESNVKLEKVLDYEKDLRFNEEITRYSRMCFGKHFKNQHIL